MTLSEDIASVSDAKFVDAKTGATLSGGAVSVSVDPTNAKVVKVDYTIGNSYEWAIHGIKLVFYVQDNAGNVSTIESNSYEVN